MAEDYEVKALTEIGAKDDYGKLRLSLVPASLERNVARIREYGLKKYGDKESWKTIEPERFFDSALRHINEMRENGIYSIDSESKEHHINHALCNLAFIADNIKTKNGE